MELNSLNFERKSHYFILVTYIVPCRGVNPVRTILVDLWPTTRCRGHLFLSLDFHHREEQRVCLSLMEWTDRWGEDWGVCFPAREASSRMARSGPRGTWTQCPSSCRVWWVSPRGRGHRRSPRRKSMSCWRNMGADPQRRITCPSPSPRGPASPPDQIGCGGWMGSRRGQKVGQGHTENSAKYVRVKIFFITSSSLSVEESIGLLII